MDNDKQLLWETVYKVARLSATRCVRIHRHLVTADDVFQHLSLWAVEHWHKIEEWEGQDSLVFKLKRTFNNESQKLLNQGKILLFLDEEITYVNCKYYAFMEKHR
jgi:hypothetical protein